MLSKRKCQRLHAKKGKKHDVVLVCIDGEFHAMEAWCSHAGLQNNILSVTLYGIYMWGWNGDEIYDI